MPQGAAFQHAELFEQDVRVIAGAVEMPVPGGAFLIAMGRVDRAVHLQHDELQPAAIMDAVDPCAVQVGQRRPVLGQGQRPGLEPPHLRGRSRLRSHGTATDDLAHDRVKGPPVRVVDIFITRQPPADRLPEQPVEPMDRVLAPAAVAQCPRRKIGQPERVIQCAHHQQKAVRTELRAASFQPQPAVEIHPISPLRTRTQRVIHETRPSLPPTP